MSTQLAGKQICDWGVSIIAMMSLTKCSQIALGHAKATVKGENNDSLPHLFRLEHVWHDFKSTNQFQK